MKKTVTDLQGYLDAITKEYPGFSKDSHSYLAEEINGVQQLYFERFHHESAVAQLSHTSAFLAEITSLEGMAQPVFSDLLAVFLDDTPLPLMDEIAYRSSKLPAATMQNGKVAYRAASGSYKQLTVIYRQRPAEVVYENGAFTGALYIPAKHMPLLGNKIRECVARTVGEYKEADYYAQAYDNWVNVLDGYENGAIGSAKRARVAL